MRQRSSGFPLLLLAVLLPLLPGCGQEARVERYFEHGQALVQEGELVKAKLEIRNALQIDPRFARGWETLGRIEQAQQNWRAALQAYSRAAELDPSLLDARARRATLLVIGGRGDEAMADLEAVLAAEPENADALAARALARLQQDALDAAATDAEAALAADPAHRGAISAYARVELARGEPDAAVARLERAIATDPEALTLRLQLIGILEEQGARAGVIEQLRGLAELRPDEPGHRIDLANYLQASGDREEAAAVLRQAAADFPQERAIQRALVQQRYDSGGAAAAEATLKRLIAAEPDAADLQLLLARLYRSAGRSDEAEALYRRVIAEHGGAPGGLEARAQLARLLLASERADEAETLAAEVLAEDEANADALLVQAELALQRGEPKPAIAAMRALLDSDPESVPALRVLGQAHAMNGETALAEDALRRAIELAPSAPGAYLQLAEIRAATGDADGALLVLEELLSQAPDNAAAQVAIARIQLGQQDVAALEQTAERIRGSRPEAALGDYLQGVALQRRGDWQASLERLETALEKAPEAPEPRYALARSLLALERPEPAAAELQTLLERDPANVMALTLLGDVHRSQGALAQARAQYAEAIRLRPTSVQPYQRLALVQVGEGRPEQALETLDTGLRETGRNGFLLLWRALVLERLQRYDAAAEAYEAVLARYPQAEVVINNLAMLNVNRRGDDPEPLQRARALVERFAGSEQPGLLDTRGWVLFRNGQAEKALPLLEQAHEALGDEPEVQYHLGAVYAALGRAEEARALLTAALEAGRPFPGDARAREMLARL